MLDKTDKIILEYLMHDCRITATKLAKITNLTQPTIFYRIQKLEKQGYISKYDVLLDFNKFPLRKTLFLISVPKDKRADFENYCINNKAIGSCIRHINKENYSLMVFSTNEENVKIEKHLRQEKISYSFYKTKYTLSPPFSIFDIPIKQKPPIYTNEILTLDEKDVKILEVLSNGGAKDSILELSRKTEITHDLVLYRYKKLKKAGYLPLYLTQINTKKYHLNYSMIHLKIRNLKLESVLKIIQKISKSIWFAQIDEENYFSTIVFRDYEEYNKILKRFYEEFDENILEITTYPIEDWFFLNRVDLMKIIENQNK